MIPMKNYKPGPKDNCYTPAEAIAPIIPYIPTGSVVWEPAAGEHHITNVLNAAGVTVVESDIRTGQDFFKYRPQHFDCIVTNSPYSLKYKWLQRCYDLGVPFALLLPVTTIGTASGQRQFQRSDIQILYLNRRIEFIMTRETKKSGCTFATAWFCHRMNLPKQINYHMLPSIPRKRIKKSTSTKLPRRQKSLLLTSPEPLLGELPVVIS